MRIYCDLKNHLGIGFAKQSKKACKNGALPNLVCTHVLCQLVLGLFTQAACLIF